MTIKDLKISCGLPSKEANLLVSFVLQQSLTYVLAHPDQELSAAQLKKFQNYAKRRLKGEPLAYITGHQEFFGLDFLVNKHTLIPRPETELMVEEAIDILTREQGNKRTIIDVGTGSGCIITALAHNIKPPVIPAKAGIQTPSHNIIDSRLRGNDNIECTNNIKFIAIDISADALKVAKKNARLNNVEKKIKFNHGNLLEPILSKPCYLLPDMCYLICANLPYLTPTQVENSPTIKYEPKSALISGPDGLDHYRELFTQVKKLSKNHITILCEIDDTQCASMIRLIKKELPNAQFEIKKDLSGYDRLAVISCNA